MNKSVTELMRKSVDELTPAEALLVVKELSRIGSYAHSMWKTEQNKLRHGK